MEEIPMATFEHEPPSNGGGIMNYLVVGLFVAFVYGMVSVLDTIRIDAPVDNVGTTQQESGE